MMFLRKVAISLALVVPSQLCAAFAPTQVASSLKLLTPKSNVIHSNSKLMSESEQSEGWNGEVVSNSDGDGRIRGCSITKVEGSLSMWTIEIDGVEADLAKFSDAIYRKITSDAKQQQFQGFRPGTIPPHLLSTYVGFAMDECAREATLEALQQQNIRPFDEARMDMTFDTISMLPPKKKAKKKKGKRKKKPAEGEVAPVPEEPKWVTYESMKEAISAGWKPGQSFSFIARNVKGQQLDDKKVDVATEIGAGGSALNLNSIQFDGE